MLFRSEKSVLLEAFRRGWPEVSSSMPSRVKLEVERFLTRGDMRFGFGEVTCETCAESRIVAFCCKSRGWCPACTTRRALDTGVHLESLLPRVAHRQWTLSLPFSVRFNVVKQPKLLKRLEIRLVKAVWNWQRREARRHGATGAGEVSVARGLPTGLAGGVELDAVAGEAGGGALPHLRRRQVRLRGGHLRDLRRVANRGVLPQKQCLVNLVYHPPRARHGRIGSGRSACLSRCSST